jgi:hypothetical protein
MAETGRITVSGDAAYDLGAWTDDGVAELTATGPTDDVLAAALVGLLATARGGAARLAESSAAIAVPIRGDGADLPELFAQIGADLLAQVDANGPGLDQIRLDGIIRTDEGHTAWGVALGTVVDDPAPVGLLLDGDPTATTTDGQITLRARLRRTP